MTQQGGSLRSALLVAMMVVALFGVVSRAAAQPGWTLPPVTLSPAAPLGWPPVVVTDAAGDATAVFATASSYNPGAEQLLSEDHPHGGAWRAPLSIPSAGNGSGIALAANAAGETTAAWVDRSGSGPDQVWISTRAYGAPWSTPYRFGLGGAGTDTLGAPGIAEDTQGDAVAVWTESNAKHTSTWLLGARRQGGVWSAPTRLSYPGAQVYDETPARVMVDEAGDFVVAWSQFLAPNIVSVEAEELIGGVWEGQQTIESGGDYLYSVALGDNAAGDASAIWTDLQKGSLQAATLRNGAWTLNSPPAAHLYAACETPPPAAAVDATGRTLIAWVGESGQVLAQGLGAEGSWESAAQTLSAIPVGEHASEPQVSVDPAGDTLVTWTYADTFSATRYTQAVWRPAGGSWGAPVTLSGPDGYDTSPSLSMDPTGNAVEAWAAGSGSAGSESYEIRATGFEATPVLSSLQLPLRATQRQSASFVAAATAPWMTAVSDHWDFGDGSGADGASVAHAYMQPGTYTVTLTVTDALLNQASVSRQLTVTASPQPYLGASAGAVGAPTETTPEVTNSSVLSPVYLSAHSQRLWLARGSRTIGATVHNTNAFPITGTATLLEGPSTKQGATGFPIVPRALAALARFNLPAHSTGRVAFRLSAAALARLRAQAPPRGHDLVQVRLMIGGSSGQTASALGVYALDGPLLTRSMRLPASGLQSGSSVPVDPWARDAC
jgi:PKD domain